MSQYPSKIVVKKYENRRLYDTTNSRYVNLEDLTGIVKSGADLQVLDAKTNEDITRTVLTQIIMEDSKGRQAGLPLELLRQMILSGDTARNQFLEWYLKNAMEAYQKIGSSIEERLQELQKAAATNPIESLMSFWRGNPFLNAGGGLPGMGAAGSAPFFPWGGAAKAAEAVVPESPVAAPASAAESAAKDREIEELRLRLEQLEKHLAGSEKKPVKRARKRGRAAK